MIKQVPGKIYLSEERGFTQARQFARYSTFSFGTYVHPDKMPYGRLYVCNDETIAPSQSVAFLVEEASHILIIPVTGNVSCRDGAGNSQSVEVEQIGIVTMPAHSTFQLVNPYQQEVINVVQVWIKADEPVKEYLFQRISFTDQDIQNKLFQLLPGVNSLLPDNHLPFYLSLGSFSGRKDTVYSLKGRGTTLFAFIIEGAFEMEGRLLHAGDAVSLWNVTEVELEALSTQALILTLEIQPVRSNRYP